MPEHSQSTRQLLGKIPNVQCLYRHTLNGIYYASKKVRGKRKEKSLQTTDRKIAERKLKKWLKDLERVDAIAGRTTLAELIRKFEAARKGKSDQTRNTDRSILNALEETWPHGLTIQVAEIRPSHLEEWLAKHEARIKNTTFNRYASVLRQMFDIAVKDHMIAESPFDLIKTQWKKPQKPIRHIPTQEQFAQIVADIRSQKFNAEATESADFVEFMGSAGLGQAEIEGIELGLIDTQAERIAIRRKKTQAVFYLPIYPHLKPVLEKILKKHPTPDDPHAKLFRMKDAKKALQAACKRLKLPHFSQRNIRQVLIRRLWKSGLDRKLIAKWQGHQDGGKLILQTYTEVFADDDASYEQQQIDMIK